MHRVLALALLLGLGCRHLPRPTVSHGTVSELPLVRTSLDDRWYVVVDGWLDEPALLFLDSGAALSTCDDALVEALDPRLHGRVRLRGEVGRLTVPLADLPPLRLGDHALERLTCAVRDLATTSSVPEAPEVRVAGVLGIDVLARFRVAIDPSTGRLRLADPADEPPLPRGGPDLVRLRRERAIGRRRTAAVSVEGQRFRAVIDTGANATFLDLRRLRRPPDRIQHEATLSGTGAPGGVVRDLLVVDTDDVRLAGTDLDGVSLIHRPGRPGLLGLDVLSRFHQEYDFSRRRGRLVPSGPLDVPTYLGWRAGEPEPPRRDSSLGPKGDATDAAPTDP